MVGASRSNSLIYLSKGTLFYWKVHLSMGLLFHVYFFIMRLDSPANLVFYGICSDILCQNGF